MIEPQSIPEIILKKKDAIDLYKWGIWIVGGVLSAIVLGTLILAALGIIAPEWVGTIGILLASSLVNLIGKEEKNV